MTTQKSPYPLESHNVLYVGWGIASTPAKAAMQKMIDTESSSFVLGGCTISVSQWSNPSNAPPQ